MCLLVDDLLFFCLISAKQLLVQFPSRERQSWVIQMNDESVEAPRCQSLSQREQLHIPVGNALILDPCLELELSCFYMRVYHHCNRRGRTC